MATMGRYCKAYQLYQLRQFTEWSENIQNLKKKNEGVNAKEVETERALSEKDIFYIQENYTVTDGIFIDENIIFDNVTPEWKEFCEQTLHFEIPVREPAKLDSPKEMEPSQEESRTANNQLQYFRT